MRKPVQSVQVTERKATKGVDNKMQQSVCLHLMSRTNKLNIPERVVFVPDETEKAIIRAAHLKHGLKKAQDVITMALRRYAEHENFELAEARAS